MPKRCQLRHLLLHIERRTYPEHSICPSCWIQEALLTMGMRMLGIPAAREFSVELYEAEDRSSERSDN